MDLFEHNGEDGVRAGRSVVHLCRSSCPRSIAEAHVAQKFRVVFDRQVCEIFDVGSLNRVFANFEVVRIGCIGGGCKEIANVFIIYFEVGDSDCIGDVRRGTGFDSLEKVFTCPWYYSWLRWRAHHRVRFPRTSLPICEDTGVISFEVVVKELFAKSIVDVFLMRIVLVFSIVRPKGVVKCKGLLFDHFPTLRPRIDWVIAVWNEKLGFLSLRTHLN